jgi:hypothetical protein
LPALHVGVTLNMSLLIVGAAAGAVGSIVHQGVVYARARHEHLKCDHVLCYVLRPVWSALLGAVAVISVNTGLISIGDQTTATAGVRRAGDHGCPRRLVHRPDAETPAAADRDDPRGEGQPSGD